MESKKRVEDMRFLHTEIRRNATLHYYRADNEKRGNNLKEKWEREAQLGHGAFSTVFREKCSSGSTPKLRAMKVIDKKGHSKLPNLREYCDQELDAIAKFSWPKCWLIIIKYESFFVQSLGWCEDESYICIAMEYMEHGDLRRNLQSRNPLPEQEIQQITIQILMGLHYLHDNGYIHRDLKPENVLVKLKGPKWWVKIGDFGISKRFDENKTDTGMGTEGFRAPERLDLYPPGTERRHPTYNMDIWSLGIMVFHMLFNYYPFPGIWSLISYVQTSIFPSIPQSSSVNPDALSFLRSLLAADASMRPSAKEALENTWLKQDQSDHTSRRNETNSTASTTTTIDYKSWDTPIPRQIRVESKTEHPSSNLRDTPRNELPGFDALSNSLSKEHSPTASNELESIAKDLESVEHIPTRLISNQQSLNPKEIHQQTSTDNDDLLRFEMLYKNGLSCIDGKRYEEAEVELCQAYQGRKKILGASHENTLQSLHWLGHALLEQEKYSAAEAELRQAYQGQKETLGASHGNTLQSLHWLGCALFEQKKYSAAEEELRQAYQGRKKTLGASHENTLQSLHWLGRALLKQKKWGVFRRTRFPEY
ncbi:hypothetical protein N7495_004687 [Penicillium taxi]|uniref:uncharacterized protein n=1 Tax=Penicillium taxi TaxID=168475 RepID=UPI002545706C|nr:uncharacterized protein N7495_004687 [Penicillium taxi]KAJ5899943.1 hypothetical protein N7495_004687 [Penicillium taxi]